MENLDIQSQRWIFRYLRWAGFGLVAGMLGSVLITFDLVRILFFSLAFVMPGLTPIFEELAIWFSQNINFVQVVVVSVGCGVLAILQPRILLNQIGKQVAREEDRGDYSKRLPRLARSFALYTFGASTLSIVSYLILAAVNHPLK